MTHHFPQTCRVQDLQSPPALAELEPPLTRPARARPGHAPSPLPGLRPRPAAPPLSPPRAEAPPPSSLPPGRGPGRAHLGLHLQGFLSLSIAGAKGFPLLSRKMTASRAQRGAPRRRPFSSWSCVGNLLVTLVLWLPAPTGRGLARGCAPGAGWSGLGSRPTAPRAGRGWGGGLG